MYDDIREADSWYIGIDRWLEDFYKWLQDEIDGNKPIPTRQHTSDFGFKFDGRFLFLAGEAFSSSSSDKKEEEKVLLAMLKVLSYFDAAAGMVSRQKTVTFLRATRDPNQKRVEVLKQTINVHRGDEDDFLQTNVQIVDTLAGLLHWVYMANYETPLPARTAYGTHDFTRGVPAAVGLYKGFNAPLVHSRMRSYYDKVWLPHKLSPTPPGSPVSSSTKGSSASARPKPYQKN